MQRAKHCQDGWLRRSETLSTVRGNGSKRKKKKLLSRDPVLVQTPPLQVAPKYIPPFCVVDEDARLETASIRRNVCRIKDADGVRKTPELTLRVSRSGVWQALFTSRAHNNYFPPPHLPLSSPSTYNTPLRLSLKSIPYHLALVKWSLCSMTLIQDFYTHFQIGNRPHYETGKAYVQMSIANKAIKQYNEQIQL